MGFDQVLIIINNFLFLLGGVAALIVGINMLGNNLERAAGRHMRRMMAKATKNRFIGVGTGVAVTALVTSSGATTVMIVGFVNVGLMTLTQAVPVIMGANIGTTITAFITAISTTGGGLQMAALFSSIAFVGVLMNMLSKKDIVKYIGMIFAGLGLIFIGMHTMSSSMGNLTAEYILEGDKAVANPIAGAIKGMFAALGTGGGNLTWQIPVLFILGAALTGLVQSSAAVTAIVMSLASSGAVDLRFAMFVILGTNVGTCLVALLSSIGTNVNARRTAIVHFCFNVIGGLIFIIPLSIPAVSGALCNFLEFAIPNPAIQIAVFHMFFNIVTTALLLPFINVLVKLACVIVPDKKAGEEQEHVRILDERLLKTPAIAVGQTRSEILKMGSLAFSNYKRSLDMLLSYNVNGMEEFNKTESQINSLNKYITQFLIKLSAQEISEIDEKKVSSFYHVTSDIERIGDYAENITEYARQMMDAGAVFSAHAVDEIREMDLHLTELYKNVEQTFANHNLNWMDKVDSEEAATDAMYDKMQKSHIRRTNNGTCTPEAGSVYLQLAVNMERIGDHMHNIANSVKTYVSRGDKPVKV